jgi:hypothetical protein
LRHTCFICGLTEDDFVKANLSWKEHIQKDHNVFSYIYYIFYIRQKVFDAYNTY